MAKTKKETYKFIVIEPYYDSQLKKEMQKGEELDLEPERAKELLDLKLVESIIKV